VKNARQSGVQNELSDLGILEIQIVQFIGIRTRFVGTVFEEYSPAFGHAVEDIDDQRIVLPAPVIPKPIHELVQGLNSVRRKEGLQDNKSLRLPILHLSTRQSLGHNERQIYMVKASPARGINVRGLTDLRRLPETGFLRAGSTFI
jgi:hypothetical protein